MLRFPTVGGAAHGTAEGVKPVACLAFVAVLATAFWAGALWIANLILHLVAGA